MAKKSAKKVAAKKPVKKTAKPQSAKPKASKPAKPSAKKKAVATKAVVPKATLDDQRIGHAAGAIWGALKDNGPSTLAALKKLIDQPTDVTHMAVGWLAREGKLEFNNSGRTLKVLLR